MPRCLVFARSLSSSLPKNMGAEQRRVCVCECVSASPACRSAERVAWRSEGGKTQTVANSVVADWQKVFMYVCVYVCVFGWLTAV